jgi:hypothetical protein
MMRVALGSTIVAAALLAPTLGRAQSTVVLPPPATTPEISEIVGATQALEGEGLAFGLAVVEAAGQALDFTWDLGDGTAAISGAERTAVTHRYRRDGDFVVRLSVQGSGGFTADRSLSVSVRNAPPVIVGLSASEFVFPGTPGTFEGVALDPGDDELTYTWDFGDGTAPVSGVDLMRPSHTYAAPGSYTLTLTVRDDDGAEVVGTLTVQANPGILGEIAGEVPRFFFAGESGRSSLLSGLGGMGLFTGAAPMSGGVANLRMMGICLVNAGFWDDRTKSHVNFVLALPADSAFSPRRYPIVLDQQAGGMAPGQLYLNALVLEIDSIYEETRRGAESMQVMSPGGMAEMIRRFDQSAGQTLGPGRNWQLFARNGAVTITRVTPERIYGRLQAALQGAWVEASGSGRVTYATVEGTFAFELDDVARANLLGCSDLPFTVESHTPRTEETTVDFVDPSIALTFTRPYEVSTVSPATLQVGFLSDAATFVPIEGTLTHDPDGRTVRFTPAERLLDAVYYHIRVRGGSTGVQSVAGDPLVEDYTWRFVTVVDLLSRR